MANVEIYTTMLCPYCTRAKALLKSKGVGYNEIKVDAQPGAKKTMIDRANGSRTVPQIFIDGRHVGGSDELAALDAKGELDKLLSGNAPA